MQWLVNKLGNNFITDKTSDGATPLHMAACKCHAPYPCPLIPPTHVPPHTRTPTHTRTPPTHTAQGNVDILKFFIERLERPEDVNIQDSIQATPAHDAAEFGQTQAMIVLLKAGADLNIQDYVSATYVP